MDGRYGLCLGSGFDRIWRDQYRIDRGGYPHLCRIDGVFDMWEDLVSASHVDDGLGLVLSFWPDSQFSTVIVDFAFWPRILYIPDPVGVCFNQYSHHFRSRHGVVVNDSTSPAMDQSRPEPSSQVQV